MKWITNILTRALDGMDEAEINDWFDDLERHGCISGMVGALVYWQNTHNIYDANEPEILSALDEVEYKDSQPKGLIDIDTLINNRVWAAFEAGARGAWSNMDK